MGLQILNVIIRLPQTKFPLRSSTPSPARPPSDQAGDQHTAAAGFGRSHADDQNGGGTEALIGPEDGREDPASAILYFVLSAVGCRPLACLSLEPLLRAGLPYSLWTSRARAALSR